MANTFDYNIYNDQQRECYRGSGRWLQSADCSTVVHQKDKLVITATFIQSALLDHISLLISAPL